MTNNPLDVLSLNETKQIKFGLWVPNVRGRRTSHIDQGPRCRFPARVLERPANIKRTSALKKKQRIEQCHKLISTQLWGIYSSGNVRR